MRARRLVTVRSTEYELVGCVTGDLQIARVVKPMMTTAQGHDISVRVITSVLAVHDVMRIEVVA